MFILDFDRGLFRVKATCGDTELGGDDFDDAICSWMLAEKGLDENLSSGTSTNLWQRRLRRATKNPKARSNSRRQKDQWTPRYLRRRGNFSAFGCTTKALADADLSKPQQMADHGWRLYTVPRYAWQAKFLNEPLVDAPLTVVAGCFEGYSPVVTKTCCCWM